MPTGILVMPSCRHFTGGLWMSLPSVPIPRAHQYFSLPDFSIFLGAIASFLSFWPPDKPIWYRCAPLSPPLSGQSMYIYCKQSSAHSFHRCLSGPPLDRIVVRWPSTFYGCRCNMPTHVCPRSSCGREEIENSLGWHGDGWEGRGGWAVGIGAMGVWATCTWDVSEWICLAWAHTYHCNLEIKCHCT